MQYYVCSMYVVNMQHAVYCMQYVNSYAKFGDEKIIILEITTQKPQAGAEINPPGMRVLN